MTFYKPGGLSAKILAHMQAHPLDKFDYLMMIEIFGGEVAATHKAMARLHDDRKIYVSRWVKTSGRYRPVFGLGTRNDARKVPKKKPKISKEGKGLKEIAVKPKHAKYLPPLCPIAGLLKMAGVETHREAA